MLCGGSIWADYYQKITSTDDLTAGDYLIVYETGNVAFNGALETLDATSNTVSVTISDNKIESSETVDAAVFTITKETDGYSIKSSSGNYIGIESYSNGLKQSTELKQYYYNTISFDTSGNAVIEVPGFTNNNASASMTLRYNSASNQARFRYFKSGQQAIQLYKKVAAAADTRVETKIEFYNNMTHYTTQPGVGGLPGVTVKTADGATVISDAEINWTSSDETVAELEAWPNGQGYNVNFLKYGYATITATYAGDDTQYKGCTASYTVTVCGAVEDGKFDFSLYQDYGSGAVVDANAYITEEKTWTAGNATLVTAGKYRWYTDGSLRIYNPDTGSTTLKISVPDGKTISQIVLTGSSFGDLTASTGSYENGTWTGSAQEVTLTRGNNNSQIKTITVNYGNPNIVAPTFSPTGGTYYGEQSVTLSTTTEGATIYYTFNESPDLYLYDGAIAINETTTINAYAQKDDDKSATVSATYTIRPFYTTAERLQADATSTNTAIGFQPESATVVFVNGKNGYLVDNRGYGVLVYNGGGLKVNSETDLAAGQVLTGGMIRGSLVLYNGSTEISGFTTEGTTIGTAEITPVEKTLPLESKNQSTLVTVKGLTYNATNSAFSDGTNTIAYYDKFSATPTLEDGKTYDVTGIVVKYDDAIQLCPRTASDIVEATSETTGFRDIKANLTGTDLLPDGTAPAQYTDVSTGVAVASDGTLSRVETDAADAAAVFNGRWHGTQYGWNNFSATVPVEGCVKITLGASNYGSGAVTVTNTAGDEVAKIDNHTGAMWSTTNTDNVAVGYYRINEATTLTFSTCDYLPYFAVEAIDEADLPAEVAKVTVTYEAGEGTGVAPAAVEVEMGNKITVPNNYTLYKEGYTLTGWREDAAWDNVYAPGAEITPTTDMTLTAVYTQNEVSLNDREDAVTVTWALGEKNGVASVEYNGTTGIIVTQATVNSNSIDAKFDVDATSAKFTNKNRGDQWAMINANTKLTVPACKDAVITLTAYATGYNITAGGNAMTDNGDKTYSYTVADDVTSIDIVNAAQVYLSHVAVTLPKVEEQQGGEETTVKTIYSWDAGTETGGTITPGGTTYLTINGKADYSSSTATLVLDKALHAGDIISVTAARNKNETGKVTGFKAKFDKGGEVASATGTEFVNINAAVADSDEYGTEPNTCTFTVPEEAAGSKTITITRSHTGTNLYIYKLVITSTAEDDPNAVATPVITPATNTFTEAQEVTITCETEGATIYYTTDGNDPTAESTEYTAAFTVSETTTVKAIAINGEYSSDIAESVITISSIQPGESNLEWDYTETAPTANPDDGLYYKGSVNDQAGTNMGLKGIKLDSSGYAWFAKNPVEGKLTLTIGQRKSDAAYAVNVYACTIDGATATKGNLIGEIAVEEGPGTGSLDIPASVTGIYIERKTSSEGVISKIVFKEKIARTFVDFEIPYATLKADGYAGADLPTGVTFSGTFHDTQHGYNNATISVPTDGGTVKFTISGCDYGNTFPVKNADNETLTTLDQKAAGCYHAGGVVTYIYTGDATTLTFGPIAYLSYFKAEATEVQEVTITYKDQNGDELGKKTVFEGDAIGEVPYTEADLTIEDGYAFRGWIYSSGVKVKATDIVDGNKSVFASVTAIETDPTAGSIQNYDLTSAIFYPEDHENFDVADATYYNNHGWNFAAGGSFSVKVAEKAQIVLTLCEYGSGTTITVTDANINIIAENVPAKAESGKDGSTTTVNYNGGTATTLTFTFAAQTYLHKVSVFNVNEFVEKDETSGYYIVPKDDAAGLVLAINAASSEANSKVFLPNGTYDLGTTALTTISGTNVSIIGESMEGVVIKNRPEIEGISITATLLNTSTGLYLQDLTLDCEAPWGSNGANAERGVTLQDKGTQTICKNVYLKGRQDTYYCNNNNGQYYFEDGKIEGTVDYICGNGDAYFQNVTLFCAEHHNTTATSVTGDCVTAPNTKKEYGYIFNECTIDGVASQAGKYSLGRPWAVGTQVIYLHTKMNILPIEAGWTDWSPANAVQQFAEFHSYDPNKDDADVDLTKRKTDFNGVANSPVLTETQAAAFKLSNVFGDWAPNQYTAQVQVEASTVKQLGNTLSWSAADGATMYAIVKNGSIIDLTDQTTYTIDDSQSGAKSLGTATDGDTATGDIYAVRAANARGGFGEAVKANVVDGIETIDADATINGTISEVYSTNGARLSAPQKGINIVKVKANDGSVKTMKVIVK